MTVAELEEHKPYVAIHSTTLILPLLSGPGNPRPSGKSQHLPGICTDFQPVWQRDGGVCPPHRRQTERE